MIPGLRRCSGRAVCGLLALALLVSPEPAAGKQTGEPREVLVSRDLAHRESISPGDRIQITGQHREAAFRVAGIFEPPTNPLRLGAPILEVRFHLEDLLALSAAPDDPYASDRLTQVNLRLDGGSDPDALGRRISRSISGAVVRATRQPQASGPLAVVDRFQRAIAWIAVLASSLFLVCLAIMRTAEREDTARTLRLIGISRKRIFLVSAIESSMLAAVGALLGIGVALLVEPALNRTMQSIHDTDMRFATLDVQILLRCLAIAVPLGAVAGLLPGWLLRSEESGNP